MSPELHKALMAFSGSENGAAAFVARTAIREYLLARGVEIGKGIHPATRGGPREGAGRPKQANEEKEEKSDE